MQQKSRQLTEYKMSPIASTYRRYGKRALDLSLTIPAILVLLPIFTAISLLTRIFLGKPVLFQQQRTGLHKTRFTLFKFRTMKVLVDGNGDHLPDSVRLTRYGRLLRSTSLDELPELWNVLLGEMSLVGPRPLLTRYDDFYSDRENLRFLMPPGLTGWAQINGRNILSWEKRLELDVWYIENCTLWLDLTIILRTVFAVIRRKDVHVNTDLIENYLDSERTQKTAVSKECTDAKHR